MENWLQVNMESIVYTKTQLIGQLEDARRRLEDEDRRRSMVEASLHQVGGTFGAPVSFLQLSSFTPVSKKN